jgi:hypothetical protein
MDNQRNKKWRRVQMYRVFKKRLVRMAAYSWMPIVNDDGTVNRTPHWFELAKVKWACHTRLPAHPVPAGFAGANGIAVQTTRGKRKKCS